MRYFKLVLIAVFRILYTLSKSGMPRINKSVSEYIIWAPDFFTLRFLKGDNFQNVLATYLRLKNAGLSVSVYTKFDIGKFNNKKILFFGSKVFNVFNFTNYSSSLVHLSHMLEEQGNKVYPDTLQANLWENKAYMHQVFDKYEINSPRSIIINVNIPDISKIEKLKFPILLKEEHSFSSYGIHKLDKYEELNEMLFNKRLIANNKEVVIQELLNIRRDLRVIIIDGNIVLHYWRINLSNDWKPTSTGRGNKVDFDNFPDQWEAWIIEQYQKLNMLAAAFDIAWQNDDLTTEPFILEVSPFFQPNPKPKLLKHHNAYGDWKKSFTLTDNYHKAVVELIFQIRSQFVDAMIK